MKKNLTVLMILAMVLWGGSWVSGKIAATSVPPMVIVFWRFSLTAVSLVPLLFVFRQSLRVSAKSLALLIVSGIILFAYNTLFFMGLKNGLAGTGGVLVTSLNPLFTFLLTYLVQRTAISRKQIAGLLIGLAGGLVMLRVWEFSLASLLAGGTLLFLIASALWACLTMVSRKAQEKVPFIAYSIYIYVTAALLSLAFALPSGDLLRTPMAVPFWLNMLYISIGVTTVATTIYFVTTSKLGARAASSFLFTVPVSAVIFSWLILGEIPSLFTILGGSLAVGAVYLLNRKA